MSNLSPLEAIFFTALEKGSPEERAAYLDEACGGDAELRRRVEKMIAAQSHASSFLEQPALAADVTADQPFVEKLGTMIGPYKLLQQIGEGGMGTVFMAEQMQPVQRKVALKVIRPGMDSKQVIARFEAERQALAMMDHVNIARVFDGGTTDAGRPYFVMELVHGVPITKYCDDNQLTPRQRLELFVPVCQAIQHAHQKGIIHRDIKPTNVMITLYDGRPVAKVIDFGVAKATEKKLTERTLFTQYGTLVGTLEYMSPEQAEMSALGVDTRSDIYSLGVLLYELLTGTTPLSRERIKQAAYGEILRMIKEEEPPKPSTRLSDSGEALASISAQRHMEPGKLTKLVRGELDWIVMKCLEKDRNRRYETANAFAADVQRYLADETVQACPPSITYRLGKFARRNKAATSFSVVVVLAGSIMLAGALWYNWRLSAKVQEVEAQRTTAAREAERADANFAKAFEAVDKFLSRIGHDRLTQVPGMEQIRREVLEEALQFFEGFLQERDDVPSVRWEAGWAYYRVAQIQNLLGKHGAAEQSYRRAIELLTQLKAEFPNNSDFRRDLAVCQTNLAMLLQTTGRSAEAEPLYRQAIELDEELAHEFPNVVKFQRNLARSYSDMGPLLKSTGRPDEAEKLFTRAIEFQERLAREYPAEPEYREDLARSQLNFAVLLKTTGRLKEAEAAYRRAVDLYEKLTADSPARASNRMELAIAHINLGILLEETNLAKDAEPSYRRALDLAGKLSADFPTVPDYRSFLAKSQMSLAVLLRDTNRTGEAEKNYLKAMEILDKLVAEFPLVTQYRRDQAGCLSNIGELMFATNRIKETEPYFRRSLDIWRDLATKPSALPEDRSQFAAINYNLANLLGSLDRDQDAESAYRTARETLEKLVLDYPKVINHRHLLGAALNNLSMYTTERGELAVSRKMLEQAIEHQQIALTSNQRHPVYRAFLANHYRSLADVLVKQKEHALAVKTADEAPKLYPKKWQENLRAAEVVGDCVSLAEKDATLTEEQRRTLAKSYADQAISWLRQAVDNGGRDLATQTKAAGFDPLRMRADFKELIKESEQKKAETKKPPA